MYARFFCFTDYIYVISKKYGSWFITTFLQAPGARDLMNELSSTFSDIYEAAQQTGLHPILMQMNTSAFWNWFFGK
jgi:hypothetical protein